MLELKERDVHFPIVKNHVKAFQLSISAEFFPFPATECLPLPGESKWVLIQHSSPLEILLFEMFQKKHCMVCFISFSSLRRSVVIETKRSCRYDHSGCFLGRLYQSFPPQHSTADPISLPPNGTGFPRSTQLRTDTNVKVSDKRARLSKDAFQDFKPTGCLPH